MVSAGPALVVGTRAARRQGEVGEIAIVGVVEIAAVVDIRAGLGVGVLRLEGERGAIRGVHAGGAGACGGRGRRGAARVGGVEEARDVGSARTWRVHRVVMMGEVREVWLWRVRDEGCDVGEK